MILVLMTARSGSSLVAKIFAAHGFDTGGERHFSHGTEVFEDGRRCPWRYETFENVAVKQWIKDRKSKLPVVTGEFCNYIHGIEKCIPPNAVVKIGVEYLPLFEKLNPKVITVKRNINSIAMSWVSKRHNQEKAKQSIPGLHLRIAALDVALKKWGGAEIDTDQIMSGDFSGVRAAFKHHGLEFDEDKAQACVEPDKWHKW